MKRIAILGSTGSIGRNTLDVALGLRDSLEVAALAADSSVKLLSEQARIFKPRIISVRDEALAREARRLVPAGTKVVSGEEGLIGIASSGGIDLVMFATSGTSCIPALIKAIESGKEIALANKESLVAAGSIVMKKARSRGVRIIPVDSEHSAIFQCLEGRQRHLSRIYLTGSGGPLLGIAKGRFDKLPRSFILRHPRWRMGRKISVDSATMMNKGLEIIEAKWLFSVPEDKIEVLIHPQAIVHSMVELTDGAVLAQMGSPDMRMPIQYALTYPERRRSKVAAVDFLKTASLEFQKPDYGRFPCLRLAREASRSGGTYPAALAAADEEAVKNYLDGRIRFSRIPAVIEKVLSVHREVPEGRVTLKDIFYVQEWAKEEAKRLCYR